MTRSLEHTTELFNRWATTYDKDLNTASGPLEGYYVSLHAAAEMLTLPNNASVLDVGIGTGKFAEIFEKIGASIFGVDVSEGMLTKCAELHPCTVPSKRCLAGTMKRTTPSWPM